MARINQVTRWEPFRDLVALQNDLSRFFGDTFGAGELASRGSWTPYLDVYEKPDSFVVKADLPGMSSEDIEVTLDQNLLSISGERKVTEAVDEENYHRIERRFGSFRRTVSLPARIDADGIQANFADGVLEVIVPKADEAKPRTIKVGETRRIES